MNYIHFDGPDVVGKTTIFKKFCKRTHFRHLAYDRSVLSNLVYDSLYDRGCPGETINLTRFVDEALKCKGFNFFYFNIAISHSHIDNFIELRPSEVKAWNAANNISFREKTIRELAAFRLASDLLEQTIETQNSRNKSPLNMHVYTLYNTYGYDNTYERQIGLVVDEAIRIVDSIVTPPDIYFSKGN